MSLSAIILRVLLPFCAGYYLSYLYRVVNAVLGPVLAGELSLGPADLGLLTSIYFIAFASFQIPLGILLDRYGPKGVVVFLLTIAAAGAFVFSRADDMAGLTLGRALIGLGVSACLMSSFKANALWMPTDRLPLANSVIMVSGGLGAISATLPVQMLLGVTDWRTIFLILSIVTLTVAVLILVVVPKPPKLHAKEGLKEALGGTVTIFASRAFWAIAPLCFLSQAALMAYQGLWMGPWLRDVAGFDETVRAEILGMGTIFMLIGFMLGGVLTDMLRKHGVAPNTVSVTGMALAGLCMLVFAFELPVSPWIIWPLASMFGTSGILSYAALSQAFPMHLAGRVNTTINLLVFIAVFFGQSAIGVFLETYGVDDSGGYAPAGYQVTFLATVGLQILALGWYLKEKHVLKAARHAQAG